MPASILSNKNFVSHWIAGGIAQTGTFFTAIALPWLVLSLTDNNPIIMSSVVATLHLPQSIFILVGGVLSDRFSPIKLLRASRIVGAGLLGFLAICVYTENIPLWSLYLFAFSLGVLGAINIPSGQSLLPHLVAKEHLGPANGIFMGTLHAAQMIGPLLAGWIIYFGRQLTGTPIDSVDYASIASAFFIDAIAVLIAYFLLLKIDLTPQGQPDHKFLKAFKEGLQFCWRDMGIRIVLCYIILISFFIHGPLYSAIPMLAKSKLALNEGSYGTLTAMISLGVIIGAGIAIKISPSGRFLGKLTLICDAIAGSCLFFIALSTNFLAIAALLVLLGMCSGVIMIAGTTWFQKRTPNELMGRTMALLMFCVMGLIPISAFLSGYVIAYFSIDSLLKGCALFVISLAVAGMLSPPIRNMGAFPSTLPNTNP